MLEIPLSAVPNQSFSIQLDNVQYDISIVLTNNVMAIDLVRDGEVILIGERLVPGYPIIPYAYLESGNFVLVTNNDEYPIYTEFGSTQTLIYFSQSELEVLRAGT